MSVSLSDSLLDLNCSVTPSSPADRTSRNDEEGGARGVSGINNDGEGSGFNDGASGSGSNTNNGTGNGNSTVAGPSRNYIPVRMEVDEDYQEFCEQFSFEVSLQ